MSETNHDNPPYLSFRTDGFETPPKPLAESELRYDGIVVPPLPSPNRPPYRPLLEYFPVYDEYDLPWLEEELTDRLYDSLKTDVQLERPPEHVDSDYAVNLHKFLRERGTVDTEQSLKNFKHFVENDDDFLGAQIEGPYLNIKLNPQRVGDAIVRSIELHGNAYGALKDGYGDRVVIDTSSPNIAKEMTVAHLRSTVIGEALGRLYQNCGYEVIRDNHLGDWGTQFGILGHAYELWSHEIPDLQEGGDPIKGLQELYVRINLAIEEEEKAAKAAGIKNFVPELKTKGQEWFRRLEEGDPKALELWQWAKDISWAEADSVYQRLGSTFEYILGESEYVGMIPSVIGAMEQSGLARLDDKGRTVAKFGAHNKLRDLPIIKSDGTSLYATRDLACLAARNAWFDPDKIIYVVGGEQRHYFEQVFHAFRMQSRLSGVEAADMEHVWFGMVSLPEGKMSTRRGNVIILADVIDEAVRRARVAVEDHNPGDRGDMTAEEAEDIAEKVGVGAVIYSELRQSRERQIKFDWNEVLNFQGNSGPYLQYTNARINAIFRKLDDNHRIDYEQNLQLDTMEETKLAVELGRFPQAIREAISKNEPSVVADYLYHLANLYNRFYRHNPVLGTTGNLLDSRLRLSAATGTVLRRGMELLGLPIPERM